MASWWLQDAVLLVVCASVAAAISSKPVSISLNSNWLRTPILLEASEFVSDEDPFLFWKFLEGTWSVPFLTPDKVVYDTVLEHAEQLLPPLVFSCLQLALSLHAHSPSIAMYQQLAEERRRSLSGGDESCIPWIEVGRSVVCSLDELPSALEDHVSPPPEVFSFDHIYPMSSTNASSLPVVILYCQLGKVECEQWHVELARLASQGTIRYVFRHHFENKGDGVTQLSGYGVQLAVKNSEYKAVDDTQVKDESTVEHDTEDGLEVDTQGFSFHTLKLLHADLGPQLEEFKLHLEHNSREIPQLKAWQLQDLGFQATQRITSSPPDMALSVIRDLTQNLPTYARSLCRVVVKKELRSEVTTNQHSLAQYGIEPGDSVVLFNGIVLQTDSTDAFNVLDVLLSESRLLSGLTDLGLTLSDIQSVIQTPVHSQVQSFAVDMRSESVVFVNNLESDRQYSGWSKSLKLFLQPTFPGSLRQVAKNAFNLVFCFDPASPEGVELAEYVTLFLDNLVPVRLGILLVSATDADQNVGTVLTRGFYYISEHYTGRQALDWLLEVQVNMSIEAAEAALERDFPNIPATVLRGDSALDSHRKEAAAFFNAKGLHSLPQVLLNGVVLNLQEDIESAIVGQLQQQTYLLQQWIYMRKVTDSTDVYDYFMERPNVLKRFNHHVTARDCLQLDLSVGLPVPRPELTEFHSFGSRSMSALLVDQITHYTSQHDEFAVRPLSVWLVADLGTVQGRQVAQNALSYLESDSTVQLGLLHNPSSLHPPPIARAVIAAEINGWASVALVSSLLSSPDSPLATVEELGLNLNSSALAAAMDSPDVESVVAAHVTYSRRVLGLDGGQTVLVANGRVVGPLSEGETFSADDFSMLAHFEISSHAHAVAEVLEGLAVEGISPDEDTSAFRSLLALKVSSLLRSQPRQRRIPSPKLTHKHSGVHLPAPESLHHVITAIVNPLDPTMQKWAHLLKVLQVVTSCDITVILNPQSKLSEVPIKSFYRYVLEPELAFLPNGSLAQGPQALFSQLPHSPLLTLHMDVPHAWIVAAVHSPHDLDNIHLQSVESAVHAEFLLEHILVEGQLFDASSGQPVPGLELVLGPPSQPDLYDTVVMANLGYFQLKANPGAWWLQIREGRSRDIYSIAGHTGNGRWEQAEDRLSVAVSSFSGEVHIVRVEKRSGMEDAHLLYSNEETAETEKESQGSMWDTLSSLMGSSNRGTEASSVGSNETINVFSIASGHLYERFLRIMMLSVLKHTTHPVKFWFLENYLSPTFKDFIPQMAHHYGFQYELVQYRWPRWLHQQTEKQRLIWGYKILFLDVLFPLSVKKIIFVDADQIVRTDLAELLEVPLNGAPYGYTPFCNDRPEMEGFRFWERGYWKNHLGSRRYHISALYVVDLIRFRQLAAGDRLRGQYQALSQDPNSLSNLDQDLPNNMIHQVPIRSLPQEWLWCETWCSEATKSAAKTIDLCNNPLTKEPKLVSAMRILPEWNGYDQEIRWLQDSSGGQPIPHKHSEL